MRNRSFEEWRNPEREFRRCSLITCLANDYGYERWLEKACELQSDPEDPYLVARGVRHVDRKGRVPRLLIRAFIQARMSSHRFPGKVLAPFRGEPIIKHVIGRVSQVIPPSGITVLTSIEASDDPLAAYLGHLNVNVFRGPLENVFERFRACLERYPCTWILRVSADSPLIDPIMLQRVLDASTHDVDCVTTILPRTFPRGNNAETVTSQALLSVPPGELTAEDKEHVMPYFYRHPQRFRIRNVESGSSELAKLSYAVDTLEDLHRLEAL